MDALRSYLINNDVFRWGQKNLERSSVLLGGVGVCLLLLFASSAILKIDRVVRVEGKVIPTGHSRPIQHLEGGIVSVIKVTEGASVKKGDILLEIDSTTAGTSLNENKIKLMAQQLRAARLKAEMEQAQDLVLPPDLASQSAAKAELSLFQTRKAKLDSEIKIHTETMRQYQASLSEAEKRSTSLSDEVDIAHKRVEMLQAMVERKAASRMELLDAQSREGRLATERQDAQTAQPKIRASLAAEQARVTSITADFRTEAQNELVATGLEIERLNETLTAATDRVNRTEIRAPVDGTINRIVVASVGAVVKPGESIIELTPISDEVLIEAHVMPQDRGELKPGLDAKVRVTAYDSASLGSLSGTLQDISADTMPDARGDAYYRAKILVGSLPSSYLTHPILPGMTISGDLVLGRRALLTHLLSPLLKFSTNVFRDPR